MFGHFLNRFNVYGAYSAVGIRFALGISRFVFGILLPYEQCQNIFCDANYLYFAIFLFVSCSIGMVVGSLVTKKSDLAK